MHSKGATFYWGELEQGAGEGRAGGMWPWFGRCHPSRTLREEPRGHRGKSCPGRRNSPRLEYDCLRTVGKPGWGWGTEASHRGHGQWKDWNETGTSGRSGNGGDTLNAVPRIDGSLAHWHTSAILVIVEAETGGLEVGSQFGSRSSTATNM